MKAFFVASLLIAAPALAVDGWTPVATATDGTEFAIKNGSCNISKYNDGVPFIRCTEAQSKGGNFIYTYVETSLKYCVAGMGVLTTRDAAGRVVYQNSADSAGTNIASGEFATLCYVAKQMISGNTSNHQTPHPGATDL